MKKLLIGIALLMTVGTVSAFGGAGTDRQGNVVDATKTNASRYAKTTIAKTPGVSRRGNLWNVKRATKEARKKTVLQKSKLRSTPRYRGSVESSEVPTAKAETMIEKAWRILREKRAKRLQK